MFWRGQIMGKIKVLNIGDLENNQSRVVNVEDKEIENYGRN